jgi:hypothetical protein
MKAENFYGERELNGDVSGAPSTRQTTVQIKNRESAESNDWHRLRASHRLRGAILRRADSPEWLAIARSLRAQFLARLRRGGRSPKGCPKISQEWSEATLLEFTHKSNAPRRGARLIWTVLLSLHFLMSSKCVSHRGENFVAEVRLAARAEPLIKRRA